MKMQAVKEKARMLDLKPGKINKGDLIFAIQTKEGNPTCFDTGRVYCDRSGCCLAR